VPEGTASLVRVFDGLWRDTYIRADGAGLLLGQQRAHRRGQARSSSRARLAGMEPEGTVTKRLKAPLSLGRRGGLAEVQEAERPDEETCA
jgi:hypothetical protein